MIPHGVPYTPFRWPENVEWVNNSGLGVKFISLGLLRPAKGIELVLAAMHQMKATFPEFTYIICGADHPRCATAREYRIELKSLVARYGLERNVVFVDRFLDAREIIEAIQSCDVGITAYTAPQQSSSGVLALMLGCGRPAISTDFQYAKASLNAENGVIVPMGDASALSSAISRLASDVALRERMMKRGYQDTRSWIWSKVARKHLDVVAEIDELEVSRIGSQTSGPLRQRPRSGRAEKPNLAHVAGNFIPGRATVKQK